MYTHHHRAHSLALSPRRAAQTLGEAVGPAIATSRLLPAVTAHARDPVPNVRFNAAKALDRLAKCVEPPAISGSVKPTLSTLAADSDADVRYYATKALSALGSS